jgi:WD40 repeat protein
LRVRHHVVVVKAAAEVGVRTPRPARRSAAFSPDGSRIVTASIDRLARIWDVHFATMSSEGLVAEVCSHLLRGSTKLSRDEMRLAGYPDDAPEIDVCAAIE